MCSWAGVFSCIRVLPFRGFACVAFLWWCLCGRTRGRGLVIPVLPLATTMYVWGATYRCFFMFVGMCFLFGARLCLYLQHLLFAARAPNMNNISGFHHSVTSACGVMVDLCVLVAVWMGPGSLSTLIVLCGHVRCYFLIRCMIVDSSGSMAKTFKGPPP